MEESKQRKPSIELLHYQSECLSMSVEERKSFVLKENGNCEGSLGLLVNGTFLPRFFILDVEKRKFSYYLSNPKDGNTSKCGNIGVAEITKVSEAPPKIKKSYAFEVNTPAQKYLLAAKDERDQKIWIQALKKAATSPVQAQQNTDTSLAPNSNGVDEGQWTAIVGGCVIKTPAATHESRRNNSNTASKATLRIFHEGYCWKQGAVMKNWKRRYFRLNSIRLSYYENKDEQNPIRSIPTGDLRRVKILERFSNRSNVIEVDTPSRKFYMDPEDIEEVQRWKKTLEDIIPIESAFLPRTKSV